MKTIGILKRKANEYEYNKLINGFFRINYIYELMNQMRKIRVLIGSKFKNGLYDLHLVDYNSLFINVPKVASTTLIKAFKEISEVRIVRNTNNLKVDFVFTFVRNPYDRLLSCYFDKFKRGELYNGEYTNGFRRNLIYLGFKPNDTFEDFLKKVNNISDENSDFHFISQYYILQVRNKYPIDFIGRFEDLELDFRKVCKLMGVSEDRIPELSWERKSKKGYLKQYYNSELKKIVYQRYEKDFDLLFINQDSNSSEELKK